MRTKLEGPSLEQQMALLRLLESKGMTTDRLTKLLASGILADVFDERASLANRAAVRTALWFGIWIPDGTIIRHVRVDRTCTPRQALNATGRTQYVDKDVLATMPLNAEHGDEVDVYFVPTKRYVLAKEVPAFLAQYGLVPDPRAQAAVNEADPAFADECPNGSQWGDDCYLTFDNWCDARYMSCERDDGGWDGRWFLSGVPASP